MISFTLHDIALVLNAKLINANQIIHTISIDSRIIGRYCLFIALKGKRLDGHNFAAEAVYLGASALLVNYVLPFNISQIVVDDTYLALGKISLWVRSQVKTKIIAITGSTGKTSVKEMTASILSYNKKNKVVATYANFNNYIGVSLTLLQLTKQDDFAVIELGANVHGEITQMVKIIRPEIVLVNNISYAHLSGFGSLLGVAHAKGEIFAGLSKNGQVILNTDSHNWLLWRDLLNDKIISWFSCCPSNITSFYSTHININHNGLQFFFHAPQGCLQIFLTLLGQHNISNAIAAGALSLISGGASLYMVKSALQLMRPIPGRLFPIYLQMHKLLLDDTYNSNISSMLVAIQILGYMPGYKVMVVSDMAELGDREVYYHRQIGRFIAFGNINQVLSFGYLSYFISKGSRCGTHFEHKTLLIIALFKLLYQHDIITILIKGSRIFAMDMIVKAIRNRYIC